MIKLKIKIETTKNKTIKFRKKYKKNIKKAIKANDEFQKSIAEIMKNYYIIKNHSQKEWFFYV